MARSFLWAGLFAAIGASALAVPAAAQFGSIFAPPRPPAGVPGGQQEQRAPAPYGAPQMPPEEEDIDDEPPPQQQPAQRYTPPRAQQGYQQPQYQQQQQGYPQQQYPQQGAPGQYRQDAVRSQPLAPPPGAAQPAQPSQQPQQQPAGVAPGQVVPPVQPSGEPQQARGAPPQPANTAPQPGDEVVVEPPSQKIANPTAVFAGLDKITGRITKFDVQINETVQFGALRVTPRVCYTRPPTETAKTDSFVEVNEVTLQGEMKKIFSGWMFAASPGLHAVEHPIYDVWLTDCKGAPSTVADAKPPEAKPTAPTPRAPARNGNTRMQRTTTGAAAPVRQPTLQQPAPVGPPPGYR